MPLLTVLGEVSVREQQGDPTAPPGWEGAEQVDGKGKMKSDGELGRRGAQNSYAKS